ncbi:MAG: hypothetical protein NVS3B21_33670 [Acidimicrobiales bacterium]
MRAVMVTWDGGSNSQPFEVICEALTRRGDNVIVLSRETLRGTFELLGATFVALPVGDRIGGQRRGCDAEDTERVRVNWLSAGIAEAVRSAVSPPHIDIAVIDMTMLSAIAACEAVDLPTVLVHHTLPGAYWGGSRGRLLSGFVGPINEVRERFGLSPASSYGELIRHADAHIAATTAALDVQVQWPVPLHYVGPLQPHGTVAAAVDLPPRFVLVSFSTTWQRQTETLQRVVDALAALDRAVVVTTGPSVDPGDLRPAANAVVVGEISHHRILDRVDLVVTHAGHGTVLSALSAGVPLVCMPMGRDQHAVSSRVAEIGAGIVVDVDAAPETILSTVRRVLGDDGFGKAAREIEAFCSHAPGVTGALAVIDRSAKGGRPR